MGQMRQGWALGFVLFAFAGSARAAEGAKTAARFSRFGEMKQVEGRPEGWTTWAARPEIAPRFEVAERGGRDGKGALVIRAAGNAAAVGAWKHKVEAITPGATYRFAAHYRTEGVPYERWNVSARLDWLDENDRRVQPPDFALETQPENGWSALRLVTQAPQKARSVVIELSLAWAPDGVVWWDEVELRQDSTVQERVVRAMTIKHRPDGTKSAAENVEQYCKIIEGAAARKPDLICLPEGITVVGTNKSYIDVAEPVPGPTTRRLGEAARKVGAYIVAGIYERVGPVVYNTAVLIDRKGELAGAYHKTHLPREEVEAGLTPGSDYPVFKTDFGTVGLMICWDVQFPEPARALALKGAEVILLPIWGGNELLARARAIENHVFLISSSYNMKTFIVDPKGDVRAEGTPEQPVAVAELNLDERIIQPWVGDMKTRTWKERRPDLPVEGKPQPVAKQSLSSRRR